MTDCMSFEVTRTVDAYARRVVGVASLFSAVFARPFPGRAWEQWYLANPFGAPLAVVGLSGGHVVAHHALVPQRLVEAGGGSMLCFLSMSTMVQREYRSLAGFLYMVDTLHEAAKEAGGACVLAFPNASSAPLFTSLCGYKAVLQTGLYNWRPQAVAGVAVERADGPRALRPEDGYSYPPDDRYWKWRTEINHARSSVIGTALLAVYKVIEPASLVLLDASANGGRRAAGCLGGLASALGVTEVRLTGYHAGRLGISDHELTSHQGYVVRLFGFPLTREVPDIRFSLLLSDVF